jgi:hypothetical protein
MKTLRDRCKEMLGKLQRDAMLRQGSPVDDLIAFVIAETGRSADKALDETLPLVLYFGSDDDRDGFIEMVRAAKPGMMTKKLP